MKNIYLIVGKSGSGKDTIVNALCDKYGYKRLISHTMRHQRSDPADAKSHIFSDMKAYRIDKERGCVVAETYYNDNYYWATEEQVDESDIYIVDIPGVKSIKERYHNKGIVVIGIEADKETRKHRMKERGDSASSIASRLMLDAQEFADMHLYTDRVINNDMVFAKGSRPIEDIAAELHHIIREYECDADITDDCVDCDTIGVDSDGKWCTKTRSTPNKMTVLSTVIKAIDGYNETDMVPVSGRLLRDVADVLKDEI